MKQDNDNWFENEWRKLEQKGYNPTAVEELYKELAELIPLIESTFPQQSETWLASAKTALTNAKL